MDIVKQLFPKPEVWCQAKVINEYVKIKGDGKRIYKIGGITTASYIGERQKSLGAPEKRIAYSFFIGGGREKFEVTKWSVLKTRDGKYLFDNYFASRVVELYCVARMLNYKDVASNLGYITGRDVIGLLLEIKKEIKKRNKRIFDDYGVPKISVEYINKMVAYFRKEFDLNRPIKLVKETSRLLITERTAKKYLKELQEKMEVVDNYDEQEIF